MTALGAAANLDGFQRAFLALRLKNFFSVASLDSPSDIYALPEDWLNQIRSDYIPEKPKYPQKRYPEETDADPNAVYRSDLMKVGVSEGARDDFASAVVDPTVVSKCLSSIRHCVGFLPARPKAFRSDNGIVMDRNDITIPLLTLKGRDDAILIALHGKGGSPEGVICLKKDYANCFGAYWNSQGYTVYAPAVEGRQDWSVARLNLDSLSSDLAKIEDLILYIRSKPRGRNADIYIAGISYGAVLAEYAAVLFDDISGLVSIGGEGRYIFGESQFSLPSAGPTNTNRNFLRNAQVFETILEHKPILISMGINDAGAFNDDGYGKFRIFKRLKGKKNIRFHFFNGGHESDPANEYRIFTDMILQNAQET